MAERHAMAATSYLGPNASAPEEEVGWLKAVAGLQTSGPKDWTGSLSDDSCQGRLQSGASARFPDPLRRPAIAWEQVRLEQSKNPPSHSRLRTEIRS